MTRLAVSGHRPDKLGGYDNEDKFRCIRRHMRSIIELFNEPELISGGALGIDQLWIETGLAMKIPVIAALPFEGYNARWPHFSRQKYQKLLDKCLEVRYISESGYSPQKLQIRNEWMVDNCDVLVAYWTGVPGGTSNCIDYAKKQNKPIMEFYPGNL
jgi:uncharacterized phage-like protein YoqJ